MRVMRFFAELRLDKIEHGSFAGGTGDHDDARMPAFKRYIGPKFKISGHKRVYFIANS